MFLSETTRVVPIVLSCSVKSQRGISIYPMCFITWFHLVRSQWDIYLYHMVKRDSSIEVVGCTWISDMFSLFNFVYVGLVVNSSLELVLVKKDACVASYSLFLQRRKKSSFLEGKAREQN
jgi:hypothetical protein